MMRLFTLFIAVSGLLVCQTFSLAWECEVDVTGPKTIKLDQQITLSASGTPDGGSYSWSRTPNLVPNGSTATLTGFQPTFSEYIKVTGYYTSPKGKKCSDSIWLWACTCSLEDIAGPARAKVGEQISLSTTATPEGGTYSWTIETGSGTLSPNGATATFVGDQSSSVEIKASYVPPEGGEPCVSFKTIEIVNDCSVSITGIQRRPVCRPENMEASGVPPGGTCSWSGGGISDTTHCSTTYNNTVPGNNTITVAYTAPDGGTCNENHNILSYRLDAISPIPVCFSSGSTLQRSDFNIYTTPASGDFHDTLALSPQTVTTNSQEETILVQGTFFCPDDSNTETTVITVINKDIKTTVGVRFEIPNLLTEPLEAIGLADKLKFELQNSYSSFKQCCTDGPDSGTDGATSVRVVADFGKKTLIGIHLPAAAKKYVTLDLLQVKLSGRGEVQVQGKADPCQDSQEWSGGGSVSVRLEGNANAKVRLPKKYLLLEGNVGGRTDIVQNLAVNTTKLDVTGKWGGFTVAGKIKVQVFGFDAPEFFISHPVFPGKATPPYSIDLPSLK